MGMARSGRDIIFQNLSFFLLKVSALRFKYRLTQGSGRSSGVEHNLAKVRVGRSNRLARSNKKDLPSGEVFLFEYPPRP